MKIYQLLLLPWILNKAISFDVSNPNVIPYVCSALIATCRSEVCLIRPADNQIQLTAQTSKEAWDDYFSTLMTLHITPPYVFPFIPPSFLDGTENWNENLAWLCIEGSLVSHFFQTGVIEMHLGRHVSAAQSQSGLRKLPALYELCCAHVFACRYFTQKDSRGCAYPCMCVKELYPMGFVAKHKHGSSSTMDCLWTCFICRYEDFYDRSAERDWRGEWKVIAFTGFTL